MDFVIVLRNGFKMLNIWGGIDVMVELGEYINTNTRYNAYYYLLESEDKYINVPENLDAEEKYKDKIINNVNDSNIVIYPERIGNILNAKNVIIWQLFHLTKKDLQKYKKSDIILYFNKSFTSYKTLNKPEILTIIKYPYIPDNVDIFQKKTIKCCYLIKKKNSMVQEVDYDTIPSLDSCKANNNMVQLDVSPNIHDVLAKSKYMITYDVDTFYIVIALLCNCIT